MDSRLPRAPDPARRQRQDDGWARIVVERASFWVRRGRIPTPVMPVARALRKPSRVTPRPAAMARKPLLVFSVGEMIVNRGSIRRGFAASALAVSPLLRRSIPARRLGGAIGAAMRAAVATNEGDEVRPTAHSTRWAMVKSARDGGERGRHQCRAQAAHGEEAEHAGRSRADTPHGRRARAPALRPPHRDGQGGPPRDDGVGQSLKEGEALRVAGDLRAENGEHRTRRAIRRPVPRLRKAGVGIDGDLSQAL
ncbi:hypothetical protein [Streptomyces sp. GZWMJZ-114]|uniref:hypothetical protein n=1 Tax=Streptomyces sp. GZWMJZ-114 TaxID=2494734 RepID=UPI0010120870|nr:hypothetical protein [Streptomyces sp. GZWMJZ-114]